MFASKITKDVVVIAEQGAEERVTIRKLSAIILGRARDARQASQAKTLRNYGGELLLAIRQGTLDEVAKKQAEAQAIEAKRTSRYDDYDPETTLNAGIVSWTVGKVTPEAIADLDEPTAKILHEAIIDLSVPFDPEAEQAKAEKD